MGHAKTKLLFLVLFCLLVVPSPALAAFGVKAFTVSAREVDGTIDALAASHPFAVHVDLSMNTGPTGEPEGASHAIQIDLPPGLLGNLQAVPRCPPAAFVRLECDGATQVGVLRGDVTGLGQISFPVFNLVAPSGYAAAFGVMANQEPVIEQLRLVGSGANSALRLSTILPESPTIVGIEEELWGVPASSAHDPERTCEGVDDELAGGCAFGAERPFLTLPASCAEPLRSTFTATSYGAPSEPAVATSLFRDEGGNPAPLFGCEVVPFEPRLAATTEGMATAPTSFQVDLQVPRYEGARTVSSASIAALHLELPEGLALNPSAGAGLDGCSPAEIGLESAPGVEPPVFDEGPAGCPASSRLGSVTIQTPLVGHELDGAIYLAAPEGNPYGARYAFYLVVEDEETGTILKIPGRLDADSSDGRLSAIVAELPQIPFSEVLLEFTGGPKAPLAGPPRCGRYETEAIFIPSTAPSGSPVTRSAYFTVASGSEGRPCPPPEAERDARPSFEAGTTDSMAGAESPLVIDLSRDEGDQHFGSFELTLPLGLVANLGSTPVGTDVGSVQVEAGVGPEPLALDGKVYLSGPYKGAPNSLMIVVPGQAGPFDLGTIVERVAVDFDPATAQIRVRADPLPQILEGVPLQLRGIRLDLDRAGFIRNPTSCEPMTIAGTATTSLGQRAPISSRFQVGECVQLAFAPKLSVRFSGALGANGHPAVQATLRTEPSGAALSSAAFTLPEDELLDLHHLRALCPRAAGVGQCPLSSRLGTLSLQSPYLEAPLEGPVYLRVPSRRLPDLSAELSFGGSRFMLPGRTTASHGTLGVSLESLPDIPLSSAVLTLSGGRRGILVNSRSLCVRPGRARGEFSAHNGMRRSVRVAVHVQGCRAD